MKPFWDKISPKNVIVGIQKVIECLEIELRIHLNFLGQLLESVSQRSMVLAQVRWSPMSSVGNIICTSS